MSEEAADAEDEAAEAASEDSGATEAADPTEKIVALFFFYRIKKIIKNPRLLWL